MNTKTYVAPQLYADAGYDLWNILCSSDLSDDGGIPDLVDDEFEW